MSNFDGLGPYIFCRKIEEWRAMTEDMGGKCLFPARVGKFAFVVKMNKVFFPIGTLIWRTNNYNSHAGKIMSGGKESTKCFSFFVNSTIQLSFPFSKPVNCC